MEFQEAVKSGFDNLTNLEGRATRSEFWWFWAANCRPGHHPVHGILIVRPVPGGAHRAGRDRARPFRGRAPAARLRTARIVAVAFRHSHRLAYPRVLHRPVFGGLVAGAPGGLLGSVHPANCGRGGAVLFGPTQRKRTQPVRPAATIAHTRRPRKSSRRGTTAGIPSNP